MTNTREPLLNAVTDDKPKMLLGLNQKVTGQVQGLQRSPAADVVPPAQRHDLTHAVPSAERGKPVALLLG